MSTESQDKNTIRRNRVILLIILLAIAGGIVWAIRADSDTIAAVTCIVGGIALGMLGTEDKNPFNGIGTGILIGVVAFFLWMAVRFIIASV